MSKDLAKENQPPMDPPSVPDGVAKDAPGKDDRASKIADLDANQSPAEQLEQTTSDEAGSDT